MKIQKQQNLLLILILMLGTSLSAFASSPPQQGEAPNVFVASTQRSDSVMARYQTMLQNYPQPIRQRFARVDFQAIRNQVESSQKTGNMTLNLFPDARIEISVEYLKRERPGYVSWNAPLPSQYYGKTILTFSQNLSMGIVHLDDKVYELIPLGEGHILIMEIEQSLFWPDETISVITPSQVSPPPPTKHPIRVLILFGQNEIYYATILQNCLEVTYKNLLTETYNSIISTGTSFKVFVRYLPTYNPTGRTFQSRLDYIKIDPAVDAERTNCKADLVSLVVMDGGLCGLGQKPSPPSANTDDAAFSVVKYSCAISNYSLPHELGHNFGMNHDRLEAGGGIIDKCNYGFWNCYGNDPIPIRYRTIMAYPNSCNSGSGNRIGAFSVDVDISNAVTTLRYGIDCAERKTNKNGAANNRQNIVDYSAIISNYR